MSSLTIVCGEPGVGKSRVADFISRRMGGAPVLRTDEIRKDLFGPEPDYTSEESQATYDEMFDRARNLLKDGEHVILDATFMFEHGRQRANALAQEYTDPYDFTIIRVTCEPSIAKDRINNRTHDASDADVSVYQSIRDRFEPVELPYHEIDNSDWFWHTMDQLRETGVYEVPSYYR